MYCQTCLIRTLLIRHFHSIRQGNLNTLKALSLTPMLNYPLNPSSRLVHSKISAYFNDELSGPDCTSYERSFECTCTFQSSISFSILNFRWRERKRRRKGTKGRLKYLVKINKMIHQEISFSSSVYDKKYNPMYFSFYIRMYFGVPSNVLSPNYIKHNIYQNFTWVVLVPWYTGPNYWFVELCRYRI